MQVITRSGIPEPIEFDKITNRIKNLNEEGSKADPTFITQQVISRISDKTKTKELDDLSSILCIENSFRHPDYLKLGAKISIDNHRKDTNYDYLTCCTKLYNNKDILDNHSPIINDRLWNIVQEYSSTIEDMIQYERDFLIDFFGFKTLMRAYLLKVNKIVVERPQHLFMRVALAIHGTDFDKVKETYDDMSQLNFIHATPTLFHAGTQYQQMSSCFLLTTPDSVDGIFDTIKDVANISKWAGGIGKSISDVRAKGSYIRKTCGYSDGILPLMQTENQIARYINQSGKRLGSFAEYIEPWHADILSFLNAKKNHGNMDERALDLFYGLWIPDLFMRMVEKDGDWYLMCPDECPGLTTCYGEKFDQLYTEYIDKGKYRKKMKARDLFFEITTSQKETGLPYMLYKDACNDKSNQKNLGTIKCSNLCTEIIEYSDENEYAVCNLGSIALPKCVNNREVEMKEVLIYTKNDCNWCKLAKLLLKRNNIMYCEIEINSVEKKKELGIVSFPYIVSEGNVIGGYKELKKLLTPVFDYSKLGKLVRTLTYNLNKIIDINYYPVKQTKVSNMKHRPIGIGVQGLADTFIKMGYAFDSKEAKELNSRIFECIYYHALSESYSLAKIDGPYSSFYESPISQGIFQFDMWIGDNTFNYDWDSLRVKIMKSGVRNSLLVAPMPTASTSQILGNNECIEPYTSNMYTRRTLSGEFLVMNRWLFRDLVDLGLWNEDMKDKIMFYRGSVQKIKEIPNEMKSLYKTAWELKQKVLVDLAADRGRFIDQSQSLNVFMENPTHALLTKYHIYSWKKGLKTGSYYIRSKPASNSQQFTIDPKKREQIMKEEMEGKDTGECLMCSS